MKVKMFSRILCIVLVFTLVLSGCSTQKPETDGIPSDTDTAADTPTADTDAAADPLTADASAEQLEPKETITIYVYTPVEWYRVYVWAWQDGGENVFEEWPGKEMEVNNEYYCYSLTLPGWVDRLIFSNQDGTATNEVAVEPGKDMWIGVDEEFVDVYYEYLWAEYDAENIESIPDDSGYEDPIYLAAQQYDYETVKSLLPTLEDRSILTDWIFNDFNYKYAIEAIQSGDYETAIEFFGYCASESDREYSTLFRQLVDGDLNAACDTVKNISMYSLESDLGLTWAGIVCMMKGIEEDPADLNYILMKNYLSQWKRTPQPTFSDTDLTFGENSTWEAEHYIGEFADEYLYFPINDLNALYKQCGSEPNGKVLILRSQKDYPNGKTYYAIDQLTMSNLNCDLYPSSLSEVEYIILVNYGYDVVGRYKQTLSSDYASVEDQFTFLRMKGRVELIDPVTGMAIEQSAWLSGIGEPELHFSDKDYQCSNMPETGEDIIAAVEKVLALNNQQG